MRVLALIPARGGSKGIPRKNLQEVRGGTLLGLAVRHARDARSVERVVVSTDDAEIAEAARRAGAEVPFLRPAALARDDTPDLPVYLHALERLRQDEGYEPDAVAWLRPTSPLRAPADVDAAVALLEESGADCVRSVCPAEHHPYWMKTMHEGYLEPFIPGRHEGTHPRRQTLPPAYRLNGAVDVVRCSAVGGRDWLFGGKMKGYVMPAGRSVDVDTEADLVLARTLLDGGRGA